MLLFSLGKVDKYEKLYVILFYNYFESDFFKAINRIRISVLRTADYNLLI